VDIFFHENFVFYENNIVNNDLQCFCRNSEQGGHHAASVSLPCFSAVCKPVYLKNIQAAHRRARASSLAPGRQAGGSAGSVAAATEEEESAKMWLRRRRWRQQPQAASPRKGCLQK
jgi:hypothetical protein